jgi:hypothetical protein
VFLDPFYSPGSDFIAISNTYISQLIGKDRAGDIWQPYAEVYQQLYFSFYDSTLAMYRNQYHLFGDAQVLPLKVLWDYTYYWGVLAALFFAERIADLPTLSRLRPELAQAQALNVAVQDLLGEWGRRNQGAAAANPAPAFLDQASVSWFAELNRALQDPLDNAAFRQRLRDNVQRLRVLAAELARAARHDQPTIDAAAVNALCEGLDGEQPPALLPAAWRSAA